MGGADDEEFQVLRAMADCMGPGVGRFTGSTLNVASLRAAMLTFSSATMETRSSLLDSRGGKLQLRKSSSPGRLLGSGRASHLGKSFYKLTGEWHVDSDRQGYPLRQGHRHADTDGVLVCTDPFDSGAERNVYYAYLPKVGDMLNYESVLGIDAMLNYELLMFTHVCTQVVKESKYEEESTVEFHQTGMKVR